MKKVSRWKDSEDKIESLISSIEGVDWGFEMYDDASRYGTERSKINYIQADLLTLDLVEINQLVRSLSQYGLANWNRYFKN